MNTSDWSNWWNWFFSAILMVSEFYGIQTKNRLFWAGFYMGNGILHETIFGFLIYMFVNTAPVLELKFEKICLAVIIGYSLILGAIISAIVNFLFAYYAIYGVSEWVKKKLSNITFLWYDPFRTMKHIRNAWKCVPYLKHTNASSVGLYSTFQVASLYFVRCSPVTFLS